MYYGESYLSDDGMEVAADPPPVEPWQLVSHQVRECRKAWMFGRHQGRDKDEADRDLSRALFLLVEAARIFRLYDRSGDDT